MESVLMLSGLAAYCGFSYVTRGITEIPEIFEFDRPCLEVETSLKLMTLNIAHGRGMTFNHQLLMRQNSLKKNLQKIAELIRREAPHFCALQECDARTFYSDKLHQSRFLAEHGEMANFIQGRHVNGMNFIYGTALLGRVPINDPLSLAFAFKVPNPTKGVVIAKTIFRQQEIDIISVHLDFMRKKHRLAQIEAIIQSVEDRRRPAIIMGDFNTEWNERGVLAKLCGELSLKAWEPSEKIPTFNKLKKRLDWILIPKEFEFVEMRTLKEKVSDHQPVIAEVTF